MQGKAPGSRRLTARSRRERGHSALEAAVYAAQLDSRMCPAVVLRNSSVTQGLGRWQK